MNWIKVEPNPADNDAHPELLPPIEKVVFVVYLNDDGAQLVSLGGRVDGEDGWLWALNEYGSRLRGDIECDLIADDEYLVTHWAEIEWPEDG